MLDTINDYQTLKLFSEGKTEGVPNFDNERAKECLIKSKTRSTVRIVKNPYRI